MSSQSADSDPAKPKVKTKLRGPMAAIVEEFHESITSGVHEAVSSGMAALGGMGTLINAAVRQIADVDTIKALADPTRLAILRALMDGGNPRGSRVMSAKELAEELGEPQTKLYRHLKVLEAQGLIVVAETRVVSGIVETRYRAGQTELKVGENVQGEEMVDLVAAAFDDYRNGFVANTRAGRLSFGSEAVGRNRGMIMVSSARLPVDRADDLRNRLQALIEEFEATPADPDGAQVEMIIGWYSPKDKGQENDEGQENEKDQ